MCGIFGSALPAGAPPLSAGVLRAASASLRHRGPDDEGFLLVDRGAGQAHAFAGIDTPLAAREALQLALLPDAPPAHDLVLGNRRLAIQDLRPSGHQPMRTQDGRFSLVYNGELYNVAELRAALEAQGATLRGASDTELLLESWAAWGPACLERFNGMFAFAIYDRREDRLTLVRDRFGIKPLYFRWAEGRLDFASELRALGALRPLSREVDEALAFAFLAAGRSDFGRRTLVRGVEQLQGGELLELDLGTRSLRTQRWYSLPDRVRPLPLERATHEVSRLLESAVELRLVSDVAVGACLSGGIDSSAVVGLAARLRASGASSAKSLGEQVQAFSARFPSFPFDEGAFIDLVLAHNGAGVRGHAIEPQGEELAADYAGLIASQELPFATPSIYAQALVFRRARAEGVTVTLDGQGADEVFAGYPALLAVAHTELLRSRKWSHLSDAIFAREARALPWASSVRPLLHAFAPSAAVTLRRRLRVGDLSVLGQDFARRHASSVPSLPRSSLLRAQAHTLDVSSLPGLLRFADRSSMASSVESRFPYLDHRVVERGLSLPVEFKVRRGTTKWILREAARSVLPPRVADRSDKLGFVTPSDAWLRGPLRELAREVLTSPELAHQPYFDARRLARALEEHAQGSARAGAVLARCLNFELWRAHLRTS